MLHSDLVDILVHKYIYVVEKALKNRMSPKYCLQEKEEMVHTQ